MTKILKDEKIINRILEKATEQILPSKEQLREKLMSGQRLRIYQGFDPSAPSLHIGHTVMMRKLEDFRKLGHEVIFLIGDYTAMIGDPDKLAVRHKLSHEEVLENVKQYTKQASKIIDIDNKENPVSVRYNGEWFSKMNFADYIELASNFTVQELLKRDMFQRRLDAEKPIFLSEFIYPTMQAYDSVMLDVDIEGGGNDQLFNMLAGRELTLKLKGKEKFIITCKLLTTADGQKMGKSVGGAISFTDKPTDIFGKVMAYPDQNLVRAFELLTDIEMDEVAAIEKQLANGVNPMEIKKRLAHEITKIMIDQESADNAKKYFEDVFQKRSDNEDLSIVNLETESINIIELLTEKLQFAKSKSEARRLIEQKAVRIDDQPIEDPNFLVSLGNEAKIVRVGKKVSKITRNS